MHAAARALPLLVALAAPSAGEGLAAAGNTDGLLTWRLGDLGPGQSARRVVLFAFAPGHGELKERLAEAREAFAGPWPPAEPTGGPSAAVWVANGATDFALEPPGAFFWERWRRQALRCSKGGQLSRLGYMVRYRDGGPRRAGIAIASSRLQTERLRVVEPARPAGERAAAAAVQTADGALGLRVRARLGEGPLAACAFTVSNLGGRGVRDVRLSVYANLEAAHTHNDDYSLLDGALGGIATVDPSGFVVAMAGVPRPDAGHVGRWHSSAQLEAGAGVPFARWPKLDRLPARWELPRSAMPHPPAPRLPPVEPPTAPLGPQAARERLEADWLFQAEGTPLDRRARQELRWARELADRLARDPRTPSLAAERARLEALARRAEALDRSPAPEAARALYLAVRRAKRRVAMKNPALDFQRVLLVDQPYPRGAEWPHQARHRNGMMAVPGGRLLLLEGLGPGAPVRKLGPEKPGSTWRPDLSFDARRVLLCYKAHDEAHFHLWEAALDGTALRQLTHGPYDDLDPIYLPDGHLMFTTTRCHTYVRCMPYTYAYVLARCRGDGSEIHIVSRSNEPDWCPVLLPDGRVAYSRWEYTDKALWRIQSLWATNPDGTHTAALWGNQSVWPDHLAEPRPIPGTRRLMFTGLAHHDWFAGSIGILEPRLGRNYPRGLTKVTCDVPWPESGDGPAERPEAPHYHTAGPYEAYKSPYPLSEEDFLVSARRGGKFRLYLMDVHGNRELVYEGAHNVWYALPVRPRPRPHRQPRQAAWPGEEAPAHGPPPGVPPDCGVLYSTDVTEGVPDLPPGVVRRLRVVQSDYKTYTLWTRDYRFEGPAVSIVQSEAVKRVLGTVPVEPDGSVHFVVPAGRTVHFQLLDDRYRAVHTMRSFTGVVPGERRGCVGCHELSGATPPNVAAAAVRRPPSRLEPPPWGRRSIGYERMVQPVLDRYCGPCHQGEGKARAKLDLTLRPGVAMFKEPYVTLVKRGIANAILAEAYGRRDPAAYVTFRPMRHLSCQSTLIHHASSGEHHGVRVDPRSLRQLIAWVDTNCPYRGEDEVRALPDPRCAEAPRVDRAREVLAQEVEPRR
ncbi:MAG: hypothetical protein ACLF0G_13235 [Candidatus Brocadiia bacterium]